MATFPSHISQWRKGLKLSAQLSTSKHNLQHILLPPFSCLHCFREIRLVAFSCQPYAGWCLGVPSVRMPLPLPGFGVLWG